MENPLVQMNRSSTSLEKSSIASSLSTRERERHEECLAKYGGDFAQVCAESFPSMGKEGKYPTLYDAVKAHSPTLPFADKVYGAGCSLMWLEVQIAEVLMFVGLRDKMTKYQREALAKTLRSMGIGYCVTMSEWMQFFGRFENGYYRTFKGYEHPNPQVVTESFNDFLLDLRSERDYVREIEDREQQQREQEEMLANAVPCPEYIKEKHERLLRSTVAWKGKEHQPKDNRGELRYQVMHGGSLSEPMTTQELSEYVKNIEGDYKLLKC